MGRAVLHVLWPVTGSSNMQMAKLQVVLALCLPMIFYNYCPGPGSGGSRWQRRVGRRIDTLTRVTCLSLVPCHLRDLEGNQLTSLEVGVFDKNTALHTL